MNDWGVSADAADLHRDAFVWDMTLPILTPGRPELKREVWPRFAAAGFGAVSITIAVDLLDFENAMRSLAVHRRLLQEQPEVCRIVDSVEDLLAATAAGLLAVGLHFQGTVPFGDSLDWVDIFYKLGIRHALMAYNEQNAVGSGCHVPEDTGLTDFGRSLIKEMNRVGMIVDCAHTGHRTAMEAIEASEAIPIVSHTNVRALCEHPRCIRDEQIRAIAAKGGVMGVTGLNVFLGDNGAATPERLVDHVDYIANMVGPEHVGLGLDYVFDVETFEAFTAEMPEQYPADGNYRNLRQLTPEDGPRITAELLRRGYDEAAIRGILGENWLRVCRAVWK